MKVIIKDQEIELRYTMRLYLFYESIAGKSLNYADMKFQDVCELFYSTILATLQANKSNLSVSYEDFIDMIDTIGEKGVAEFTYWFLNEMQISQGTIPVEEEKATKTKSKKK